MEPGEVDRVRQNRRGARKKAIPPMNRWVWGFVAPQAFEELTLCQEMWKRAGHFPQKRQLCYWACAPLGSPLTQIRAFDHLVFSLVDLEL